FIAEPIWRLKINLEQYYDEAEKNGWPDLHNRGKFKYGWDAEKKRGILIAKMTHIMKDSRNTKELERVALGAELGWSYYGGFGFAPLLGNPGEKLPADMIVPFDLLRERGAAIVGTAEEVAEQILKIKTECGFKDFNFVGWFEMGGFAAEEIEEQMHLFSEQVLPILRRECGPSPWQQRASN